MPAKNFVTRTSSIVCRQRTFTICSDFRPGDGHPIVFLHGLGSTKNDFHEAFEVEGLKEHAVLMFDFPGSGNSDCPEDLNPCVDDLVEITSLLIVDLELKDIMLVGHSMGGLTALLYTRNYPDNVRGFINVEGNLAPEDCDVFSRKTARLTRDQFAARHCMKMIQAEFGELSFAGARLFAARLMNAISARAFYDYCISIVRHSDTGQLMRVFQSLPVPRLFVYGEANRHLSYLPDLRMNGIEVAEIPFSHHWPHLDNPAHFYQTVGDFISRQ